MGSLVCLTEKKGGSTDLDILTWGLKNHHKPYCRLAMGALNRTLVRINPELQQDFTLTLLVLQDLIRVGGEPDCYIFLGANVDPLPVLASIPKGAPIIIGGNKRESDNVKLFTSDNFHFLDPSVGTNDEVKRAIDYAVGDRMFSSLGIVVQEIHCPRAMGTFIQELEKRERLSIKLIPLPSLIPGRNNLPPELKRLATQVEAIKLRRYRSKGDVASLELIEQYVERHGSIRYDSTP